MSDKIKGVLSCCDGDRHDLRNAFLHIDVVHNHPIFESGELAPVAYKIGLELLALQVPSFTKKLHRASGQLDNEEVKCLMIDTVSGLAAAKWHQAGSTLFVRQDKKPLTINHLQVLWMFNVDIVGAFSDDAHCAHEKINRENWDLFWNNYKERQIRLIRQSLCGSDRSAEIVSWENDFNPLEI